MECTRCGDTRKILVICPLCDGRGKIEETLEKCSTCKGKGQVLGKCGMCDGRGTSLSGNMCHHCGGTKEAWHFCPDCEQGVREIKEKIIKDCPKCYTQGQIVVECPDCKDWEKYK